MSYAEYMGNRYIDHDIASRLSETFIRYDGKAVYVGDSDPRKKMVSIYQLPMTNTTPKWVAWSDPKLDISSIELGYSNTRMLPDSTSGRGRVGVVYLFRNPQKRTYRQGVHHGNVSAEMLSGHSAGQSSYFMKYNDKDFADLLNNVYPDPSECHRILCEHGEVAVSKELAISQDRVGLKFFYVRGEQVGFKIPGDTAITLRDFKNVWAVKKIINRYHDGEFRLTPTVDRLKAA